MLVILCSQKEQLSVGERKKMKENCYVKNRIRKRVGWRHNICEYLVDNGQTHKEGWWLEITYKTVAFKRWVKTFGYFKEVNLDIGSNLQFFKKENYEGTDLLDILVVTTSTTEVSLNKYVL